jgi:Ricin-type beta-trefoil lectin domain/Putative Ig domain
MRVSIRPGRRLALAVSAGVLLSGSALAAVAATVPAQAGTASAGQAAAAANPGAPAPVKVTVASPGPTTEPLETPIDLSLNAADANTTTGYPLTWSASALPAGLTIAATNADGTAAAITGTATVAEAGPYNIVVTATDADAVSGTASFKLTLANTVTVTNPGAQISPPDAVIKPLAIAAADNDADATLTYAASDLPAGLAIDPTTGVITGEPTTVAVTDVTVTATDDTGAVGTAVFSWTVGNKVTVTVPESESTVQGLLNLVGATATDSDKTQTITWSAKSLPPGLSLSTDGTIDGRVDIVGRITATGVFKTVVTATDGIGSAASATMTWHVGASIDVRSGASVTTVAGRSMAYKLTYSDAVPGDKVTWTAAGLPSGVGFQPSSLLLYGWPVAAGTHTVVFKAKGSLGTSDQKVLKLVVKAAPDSGAVGQVHLADGKCLQDPGNRTANGTRVEIENCVSGSTQRWTIASDNTVRVNGRCLNIAGSGSANGRQLQVWSCNGSTRQVWMQGSSGELVNPASGLCVTDPGSSRNNGVTPTMGACHARSSQQWTLPAQQILTPVGGACADDPLGVGTNGTVVDMFPCNGTPGQAWDFEPNGTIRISQYRNVCLTLRKSEPVLWVCGTSSGQKWSVNRAGGLGSELAVGGVCLATKSLTASNASKLVTARCAASNPLDLWHIE